MYNTEKIREVRISRKLSQEEIAKVLNISRSSYAMWESNNSIFPINRLIDFCDYLNISLDFIFNLPSSNKEKYIKTNEQNAGLRLKTWRKENKITQEKLAKILNTNRSVIANYERGRNYIATAFLYTICNKYKVSADYLLGRID